MRDARVAGFAGIGFVIILIVANLILMSAGLPLPSRAVAADEIGPLFARGSGALRLASTLLPAAWLLATVFAVGLCARLRSADRGHADPWAVVGAAGVLMQSVAFAGVEAARLALAFAAQHDGGGLAGLWGLYCALFGFNQVFLATALLGLSVSGLRTGFVERWHAGIGLVAAALLFAAATASPYAAGGPFGLLGLAGWLLWLVWIVVYGSALIRRPGTV